MLKCLGGIVDLAVSAVVGISEERFRQVGQEILQDGSTLMHRELVLVQIQRDSLQIEEFSNLIECRKIGMPCLCPPLNKVPLWLAWSAR